MGGADAVFNFCILASFEIAIHFRFNFAFAQIVCLLYESWALSTVFSWMHRANVGKQRMIYWIEQVLLNLMIIIIIIEMNIRISHQKHWCTRRQSLSSNRQLKSQKKFTKVKKKDFIWNWSEKYFELRTNDEISSNSIFVSISSLTNNANDNGIRTAKMQTRKATERAIERI